MKMLPQQYCLRWRYHHSNLQTMFSQLLEREAFCDVTLACEGRTIKAHKIVLSACSTYFESILSEYEEKDPIVIMKDVKYIDIKCLVEFMYKGEINVDHCHLATLLKTAEELRIKGLAEVSWKDEEGATNGIQAALPNVSTVMDSPKSGDSTNKRKRGRPPIDDYDTSFPAPKIVSVAGAVQTDEAFSNDAHSSSDQDQGTWDDDNTTNDKDDHQVLEEPLIRVKTEITQEEEDEFLEPMRDFRQYTSTPLNTLKASSSSSLNNSGGNNNSSSAGSLPSGVTAALEKEWPDVIKMNDYLNTGRRQQFWEEPFTKRVMDAIKTKNLEMKIAAELLGVSYGTLYGRYRDAYGCLKHPYRDMIYEKMQMDNRMKAASYSHNDSFRNRVRDFWTEQGPTDVLSKLKRKEITLFRAAEQLNVTPQTLSNYLISMSVMDTETATTGHISTSDTFDELDSSEDSDATRGGGGSAPAYVTRSTGNSVLANCPDITIIKKEKMEGHKVNNNSDHHHSSSADHSSK